ncbi:hypothetical protein Emag_002012 [Eimeria magna]
MVGSTVLWELKPGDKPLYPLYLADSLLNTDDNFDADKFRKLQTEMESGAPLLLLGHTFTNPGIAVFAVNTDVYSIAIINVVDDEKQCGSLSLNVPHPLTDDILEALPIAISDMSFFGTPSWTVPCIIFVFVMLFIAVVIVLQSLVRNRYWTFISPPRVEEDDEATEDLHVAQNFKAQQSILCCKGALEEEPDLEDTLNDLDPRIFQAVYWKLLDSMTMVKDQLDHLGMHQDKLIELGIDIAPPLRASILPTLAEASEKKSRAEAEDMELSKRLTDLKNLMLLRKGALEEAVQRACEALTRGAASDLWTAGSEALKTQEALISEQRNLYDAGRSMCSMLSGLLHQRNEILMQQQISRDEMVVQEIGELCSAVATLFDALYGRFVSSRRDVEKALSNRQQAWLPSLQKQFEEAAENIYIEFTNEQQEAEAKRQEQARERSSKFAQVVQDFLMQCRKSLDEAERRKLVAEKARNDRLARVHLESESTQRLSEEYKANADEHLKALAVEQEAALADLKVAMERECTRIMRIHKSRARITKGFRQGERKGSSVWHKTKFRLLTDELPCFLSAQAKLEGATAQLILKIPNSVHVTGELQQCLDVCNRKIRSASEAAARALTFLHKTVVNSVVQEVQAAASAKEHKEALQEVLKGLKAESAVRYKELEAKLDDQIRRRGHELEEEQEECRKLALERIAAAVEAQEKCSDWVDRQAEDIMRDNLAKARENEWISTLLENAAIVEDSLVSATTGQPL